MLGIEPNGPKTCPAQEQIKKRRSHLVYDGACACCRAWCGISFRLTLAGAEERREKHPSYLSILSDVVCRCFLLPSFLSPTVRSATVDSDHRMTADDANCNSVECDHPEQRR